MDTPTWQVKMHSDEAAIGTLSRIREGNRMRNENAPERSRVVHLSSGNGFHPTKKKLHDIEGKKNDAV